MLSKYYLPQEKVTTTEVKIDPRHKLPRKIYYRTHSNVK